jgi:steroid delta-isomerase
MPAREQVEATVRRYVDAVGRQDLEATVALFAEQARQEDPVGTPPNVGREAIRAFFERSNKVPFTTTLTGPLLVTGDHAAVHFTIEVQTGAADPMVVQVIDLVRVDDEGLIADLRAVVDAG